MSVAVRTGPDATVEAAVGAPPRALTVPVAGWVRAGALGLAVTNLIIGAWGTFMPRSFYSSFPGGPLHWVNPLGSYDTHLVTDVGESYLMMAVLLGLAAWQGSRVVMQIALVTVLVQAVPHAIFHLTHLGTFSFGNGFGVSTSVLASVFVPLVLLVASIRPRAAASRVTTAERGR